MAILGLGLIVGAAAFPSPSQLGSVNNPNDNSNIRIDFQNLDRILPHLILPLLSMLYTSPSVNFIRKHIPKTCL
jgi:hypothetical protein